MDWNVRKFTGCTLILFSILSLISVAGAEIQVYQGDSVSLEGANSTITWGRNYSFNVTRISEYNRTLQLGDRNISVYAENNTPVNVTLWSYNFSNPSYGDTLIRLGVAPTNATVHVALTGVPAISSDKYQLRTESEDLNSFRTGGTISWSYSGKSAHNFTIDYEKIIHHGNSGGNSGGGGSSGGVPYTPSDCGLNGGVQSHSWSLVNRNKFQLNDISNGIQQISVETRSNQSEFKICAKKLENRSEVPEPPNNTYVVYRLKTDGANDAEISLAKIRFTVNKSYAENYDRIILNRYSNGWNDLPTTKVGSSDDKWIYEATSPGFSYYAVRGKKNRTNQFGSNSTDQKTVCGDNTCDANETWKTCNSDCQKPPRVTHAENSISKAEQQISKGQHGYQTLQKAQQQFQHGNYTEADSLASEAVSQNQKKADKFPIGLIVVGIVMIILVVIIGYIGYRKWLNNKISSEVSQILNEVSQRVRNVENSEEIIHEIDDAEQDLKKDRLHKVKKHLDKTMEILGLK